jgi:hypothetical protein
VVVRGEPQETARYGIEICRNFERDHIKLRNGNFELQNFDGDRFAKFVLAIFWRASISTRPGCAPSN